VRGGLDLEDANSEQQTVFSGIPDAIQQGLLTEAGDVDPAVSRLFYVRMRTGEFDPPSGNPYRQARAQRLVHASQALRCDEKLVHMSLSQLSPLQISPYICTMRAM